MPTDHAAIGLVVCSVLLGLVLTRAARGVAARVGMVDAPDGGRKRQARPVPVAGGVAVLIAAVVTLLVVALVEPGVAEALTRDPRKSLALLAAALLITGLGVVDDRHNLPARYKAAGQVAAALVLVVGGDVVIHRVGLLGQSVPLGPFAAPLTVLWLVACVNALNLIDGMDGLLGTVGGIALLSLAAAAAVTGDLFSASVALAVAGAVVGFLWWNAPPATVYMGDAGSMLVGLVAGAVAVPTSPAGVVATPLAVPVAILVLPVFDTCAAVVRRKLTGRGLASADRGHLHHTMLGRGLTPPRVLAVVAALGLFAAAGALLSVVWGNDLFALAAAAGVVTALVAGNLFGNAELALIRTRASALVRRAVGDGTGPARSPVVQGRRVRHGAATSGLDSRFSLWSPAGDVSSPAGHGRSSPRPEISLSDERRGAFDMPAVGIVRDAQTCTGGLAPTGHRADPVDHRAAERTDREVGVNGWFTTDDDPITVSRLCPAREQWAEL